MYPQINNIMGQYYHPVILHDKVEGETEKIKAHMYSHDFGCGLKLMEHSWLKNPFVQTFEKLLTRRGGYYKSRVVWAGDYADEETDILIDDKPVNLNSLCSDELQIKPDVVKSTANYPYILNHSKKLFVDKTKVISKDGWQIHPLPLLTCEGNGRGGGDFGGEDKQGLVGSWARDVISVEKNHPHDVIETQDYKEIEFDLFEEW